MAETFEDIAKRKSLEELREMKRFLGNYIPMKQRVILAELEIREARAEEERQEEMRIQAVRETAARVTRETLQDWFSDAFGSARDEDEKDPQKLIANTLSKLVKAKKLSLPKDGFIIRKARGGVSVEPVTAPAKQTRKAAPKQAPKQTSKQVPKKARKKSS